MIKNIWLKINYWKLAIAKCANKCLTVFLATFLSAVKGLDWNQLNAFDQVCIIIGCLVAVSMVIDAFLDQTMSRLKNGLEAGDTTHLYKDTPKG